jgi:hypothetical protein
MTRAFYRCLLQLHPRTFRQQFAAEMLWIFDEAVTLQGPGTLLADGFISLLRQWLLRNGTLKIVGGLVGGLLYVSIGLLLAASAFP